MAGRNTQRDNETTLLQFNGNTREVFSFIYQYEITLQSKGLDWVIKDAECEDKRPRLPKLPNHRIPNRSVLENDRPGFMSTGQPFSPRYFQALYPEPVPRGFVDPSTLTPITPPIAPRLNGWDAPHSEISRLVPMGGGASPTPEGIWGDHGHYQSTSTGHLHEPVQENSTNSDDRRASGLQVLRPAVAYDGKEGLWPYYIPIMTENLSQRQIEIEKLFQSSMKIYDSQLKEFESSSLRALGIFRQALSSVPASLIKAELTNSALEPDKRLKEGLLKFKLIYCTSAIKLQNCALIEQDIEHITPVQKLEQAELVIQKLLNLFEERELLGLPFDEHTKIQKLFGKLKGSEFTQFIIGNSENVTTFNVMCAKLRATIVRVQTTQETHHTASSAKSSNEGSLLEQLLKEVKSQREELQYLKRRMGSSQGGNRVKKGFERSQHFGFESNKKHRGEMKDPKAFKKKSVKANQVKIQDQEETGEDEDDAEDSEGDSGLDDI